MTRVQNYKVLICDDDHGFAKNLKSVFERKAKLLSQENAVEIFFDAVTLYDELVELVRDSEKAQEYQIIFCDLGWGNQNLAGVQILNDFQMSHPYGKTILYTAQDADEIISQTLEWKLHFIDKVIAIQGNNYLDDLFAVVEDLFSKDWKFKPGVLFKGKRMICEEGFEEFSNQYFPHIQTLQKTLGEFLEKCEEPLALNVLFDQKEIQVQFKASKSSQATKKYEALLQNYKRFPRLEQHDLLALSKAKYVEFIKNTYGGFPEMAKARFLDLNNIYRVNRKFKNQDFIVFQFETVLEIMGSSNQDESYTNIKNLLAKPSLLKNLVEK